MACTGERQVPYFLLLSGRCSSGKAETGLLAGMETRDGLRSPGLPGHGESTALGGLRGGIQGIQPQVPEALYAVAAEIETAYTRSL